MKNIYFLSDAHLGSLAIPHQRMQERRLVRFLDSIKEKAAAIYLLGDMFDFWYEYKYVVPKGFTRFLGKLSELTDMGVMVIPQDAVVKLQDKQQVYKVQADSTVTSVEVTTQDIYNGKDYMVTSGLNVGDKIVTIGANNLQEGQKVLFPSAPAQ